MLHDEDALPFHDSRPMQKASEVVSLLLAEPRRGLFPGTDILQMREPKSSMLCSLYSRPFLPADVLAFHAEEEPPPPYRVFAFLE